MNIASDCLKTRRQIVELGEQNTMSETRTSYALSLYHKISGIAWNYDESNTHQLTGSKCLYILYAYYYACYYTCIYFLTISNYNIYTCIYIQYSDLKR